MCGICGINESEDSAVRHAALVGRMAAALAHRGPDADGVFTGEAVVFGHRRLSIVDLTHGQQPMFNEDGRIVVICNGVIYNAPRLPAPALVCSLNTYLDQAEKQALYRPDVVERLGGYPPAQIPIPASSARRARVFLTR